MTLPVSSSLIAAQAQSYAAASTKGGVARSYAPPAVEKLAARGSDNAVRVEISAEARKADQAKLETRDDNKRAEGRAADQRMFAREAPLRGFDAQQNAGTRNTRPGTTLDIRI
ncbi:hypothetical protein [Pyruvatibacter sp.]|uniref:hypothetical protein n=1 Tax=Pyruvatibacter sp. TaxID=1981328 RepID=UPI0032EF4029